MTESGSSGVVPGEPLDALRLLVASGQEKMQGGEWP